jgi:hypothetical protein
VLNLRIHKNPKPIHKIVTLFTISKLQCFKLMRHCCKKTTHIFTAFAAFAALTLDVGLIGGT